MAPKPGWSKREIAKGRKPNYVPNNKEEIVRIIEGRDKMHDCKDMWEPIGEKAWPLRMAIPATLKFIGRLYMYACTLGVSMAIVYIYVQWLIGE